MILKIAKKSKMIGKQVEISQEMCQIVQSIVQYFEIKSKNVKNAKTLFEILSALYHTHTKLMRKKYFNLIFSLEV